MISISVSAVIRYIDCNFGVCDGIVSVSVIIGCIDNLLGMFDNIGIDFGYNRLYRLFLDH